MSNALPPTANITQAADLSRRVQAAAQDLFGLTDKAHDLISLAKRLESETAEVMDHRVPGTVIAFVGGKNAGKTTLASLLVDDGADSTQELQRHAGREKDTLRLGWIGVTPPSDLKPEIEEFTRGTSVFGRDCWLLDCPSFAGETNAEKDAAAYALLLADLNVLVITDGEMRSDINPTKLKNGNGSIVLPVVRKEKETVDDETSWEAETQSPKFRESVDNFVQRLRSKLPDSKILEPVVVPDFKGWGGSPLGAEKICRSRVREALRRAVELAVVAPRREKMARDKIQNFRVELRRRFSSDIERLSIPLEELSRQQEKLPTTVAESFLGPDHLLCAAVRSRLLWRAASEVWLLWFPFRSITWLLALTAGAWDRLFLALAGSAPSLVLTYFTAARNVRDLAKLKSLPSDTLRLHFERALMERLQPALQQFRDGVSELVEIRDRGTLPRSTFSRREIRVSGFDTVKDASARIFADCLETHRVPIWWIQTWGLVATSTFGWLAWHPMRSLYQRFLDATAWQEFPTPATSMVVTSVLLSALPVFLAGVLCLALGMAIARVPKCVEAIRQRHHDKIKELSANGTLRMEFTSPHVEAARTLLSLAGE